MSYPEFYDSNPGDFDTDPGHYPAGAERAVLYADTSVEAGYRPQPNPGVPLVRFNTRRGGAEAAPYAGVCDYEAHNLAYSPGRLGAWAAEREVLKKRARVYCNRSDVRFAWPQVGHLPNVVWWIAVLDNNPHWTPELVVASVRAVTGIALPAGAVWGIQWGNNPSWDTSYLTGTW
jgi:hypothetical protein